MSVNYAASQTNTAYLNQRFGLELAHLLLGIDNNMIEAIVGRYSRGKRKGQLRGAIQWKKVTRGGWMRNDRGGRVAYPGEISDVQIVDAFTGESL